jgi:16S rRNA (uracil1498-N3)-methyltransferase
MRRRFFIEGFENNAAEMRGDSAHHLARVLRAESGNLYELSDGNSVWLARAERVSADAIQFALVEPLPSPVSRLRIVLLLSIVKFDHFEWALEKATELGADVIVPLAASRCESGLIAAATKRATRWKKILVESAQQSRRIRVPELQECQKVPDALRAVNAAIRIMLSEQAGARPLREILEATGPMDAGADILNSAQVNIALAVGPEGGWTEAEFAAAVQTGFSEAALGANILRTETAVCVALAAMQYAFGTSQGASRAEKQD